MKKSLFLLVALVMVTFGSNTHAAYVTTFEYTLKGTFSSAFLDNGNTLTPTSSGTVLTWGSPANPKDQRSSLVITNPAPNGLVDTYIGGGSVPNTYWADSINMTHNNFPIYAPALDNATLQVQVDLKPHDPSGTALPTQTFTFDIEFEETDNDGSDENDVFALLSNYPNFDFYYDVESGNFSPVPKPGYEDYFVNVFPSIGGVLAGLTNPYAGLAGVPVGTIGFTTPENQATTLGWSFTISTEPLINGVPEPSTAILLGASLLGIAGFGRKIRKS